MRKFFSSSIDSNKGKDKINGKFSNYKVSPCFSVF